MVSLDRNEFQRSRSVSEYQAWVKGQCDALGQTEAGKTALRLRDGLAKQLVEEAYPLGLFASCYFGDSDQVFIGHVLGSQQYDAKVDDQRTSPATFKYIEITLAHEGMDEYFRRCALERDGSVCSIGTVERTEDGPRVPVEAKSGTVLLHEEIDRIKDALSRKANKPNYPTGTALVIVFNDSLILRSKLDRDELLRSVQDLLDSLSYFAFVGCIGLLHGTFIDLRAGQ